jgi:methionyl-tRNA formyltransferase
VTIARVTASLDSGPVALESRLPIGPGDDRGSLGERLEGLAVDLALRAIEARARGPLEASEQGEEGATYAEKIDPAERRLDVARPATELERIVRALHPSIGAHLELEGEERLGVARARAEAGRLAAGEAAAGDGDLLVGTADGVLRVERVKPAGGREMAAAEYLRGHPAPRLAVRTS